jgi:hypothetical protein
MARLRDGFEQHRPLIGKLLFEIFIIFVGVTAAFALEAARQERDDAAYRNGMIAALIPTFNDFERHSRQFQQETGGKISAFDAALARGEQPRLPIYREPGGERPPSRAWDGIVATGVSKALPPELYYELSRFYTRQESFGERYVRYAQMTEQQVLALGPEQRGIYEPATGKLKPEYAAYVDRLRDLIEVTKVLDVQARELRAKLRALG